MNANDVKKDLYKSKNMARFSHYVSGNLYYKVELEDGTYQFPIAMIEEKKIETLITRNGLTLWGEEVVGVKLSEDLGQTTFANVIKGSDLNRWITKAIDNDEFIKIEYPTLDAETIDIKIQEFLNEIENVENRELVSKILFGK